MKGRPGRAPTADAPAAERRAAVSEAPVFTKTGAFHLEPSPMPRAELTPRQRKVWASLRWRARHRDQYDAYRRANQRDSMRRYRARKREARSLRGG